MARDFGSGLRRSRLTPYCNAEGALFRDVLLRAARACELRLVEILGRMLGEQAEAALAECLSKLQKHIAKLGKSVALLGEE